jgi:5-methylcytosine-specific restriction endonuclease McrA
MENRHKKGDTRADGMIFWAYVKGCKGGEYWLTPEKYEKKKKDVIRWRNEWAEKNRERLKKRNRERYWSDPEASKKKKAEWAKRNRERVLAYARRTEPIWRNANREKVRAQNARWRNANKEKIAFYAMRRIARKRAAIPAGYDEGMIQPIYDWCARVTRCLSIPHHVDHIVPLSRGGPHHHENLQVLPAAINAKKSNLTGVSLPGPYRTCAA